MGLNSKESVVTVKEETVEGCIDSGSGVPWPFPNKVSTLPHFMSFKTAQEDKKTNAFCPAYESASGEIQNAQSGHLLAGAGQNFSGVTTKQQFFGGIPLTFPHSALPSLGSVAGITQPWFNTKVSGGPAQLTIFYAGTVNVYDDISPEKAQAIMFLAGNGASIASNVAQSRAQVQPPISKLAAADAFLRNHPVNAPPGSGLSSPMSVSSHPVGQSCSGSTSNNEVMTAKVTGVTTTPENKVEPPKIVTSGGPVAATTMLPSAVPQARKASLARFLEKRKERVMNSAPYNLAKKYAECGTPGQDTMA